MSTVLITGAGGVLGRNLIGRLLDDYDFQVYALTSRKDLLERRFPDANRLSCFGLDDTIPWPSVQTVIHCAFAVRKATPADLAQSLLYTRRIASESTQAGVPVFVNISSRSVYGAANTTPCTENAPASPDTIYGMAKYAAELLIDSLCDRSSVNTRHVHLRLGALLGPEIDMRVVSQFVQMACRNEPIRIVGGEQVFQFMDVRDAGRGIAALLKAQPSDLPGIYNLGNNRNDSLRELVAMVEIVAREFLDHPVEVVIEPKTMPVDAGMDSSLFYRQMRWQPKYDMHATIRALFQHYIPDFPPSIP